jgi:hypothetical protein
MCDYSLMGIPNRLAQEGEDLITHRFPTGSLGLASPCDLKPKACAPTAGRSFWAALKGFFNLWSIDPVSAVCIPPGARLQLQGLPVHLQHKFGVGPVENVTFAQISSSVNNYRDAVRFANGREWRIQELSEALHVKVLALSLAEDPEIPHGAVPSGPSQAAYRRAGEELEALARVAVGTQSAPAQTPLRGGE